MKIENALLIGLLIFGVAALIYSLSGFLKEDKTGIKSASKVEPPQLQPNSEKKVSESSVSIDITPAEFKDGKMYFDIGVNTHSVDLSPFDFKELTALEFEGRSIKPESVPKLTGHHNSGILSFNTGRELKNFKIKVKGIPDIEERVFEWP